MEKTIYEIKYNDWLHLRMTSERQPLTELEFDKAAFEAVLADILFRMRERREATDNAAISRWLLNQIGLALQSMDIAPSTGAEQDPLDTVSLIITSLKESPNESF